LFPQTTHVNTILSRQGKTVALINLPRTHKSAPNKTNYMPRPPTFGFLSHYSATVSEFPEFIQVSSFSGKSGDAVIEQCRVCDPLSTKTLDDFLRSTATRAQATAVAPPNGCWPHPHDTQQWRTQRGVRGQKPPPDFFQILCHVPKKLSRLDPSL